MVNLIHCAELVITGINYADCDGTYKLNDTCTKDSSCDIGGSGGWPLHFSRGDASNGRQMWWCGKGDDDPAGAYSCTPWETTPCGGSFGATNKEGAGYSCTQCAAGWGGALDASQQVVPHPPLQVEVPVQSQHAQSRVRGTARHGEAQARTAAPRGELRALHHAVPCQWRGVGRLARHTNGPQ